MTSRLIRFVLTRCSAGTVAALFPLMRKFYPVKYTDPVVGRAAAEAFGENEAFVALIRRVYDECAPEVRRKLLENLILRWRMEEGHQRRKAFREKYGFDPPMFFVISPTMRCNLKCKGCYSAMYSKDDDMPLEVVDDAIRQGKEMGMFFFTISGGEPFIRKDLLELFAEHDDCFFLVYTNGCLIDESLARMLAQLGNVAPAVSVEGYARHTDARRGEGVQEHVERAMRYMREAGVFFGFSATPTRLNGDVIATEEFFDYYIELGCKFGWLFQYIPIGRKPDLSLMATPEQRNALREVVRKVRKTRPIFIGDFWNDGPLVGGCMAGGRLYFHINVHGGVEPCVFQQFWKDNIKEKPLVDILRSDYFTAIREAQKDFRDNLYTPCMIIDHPEVLKRIVERHHPRPSYPGSDDIVKNEEIHRGLCAYARRMDELSRPVYESRFGSAAGERENGELKEEKEKEAICA